MRWGGGWMLVVKAEEGKGRGAGGVHDADGPAKADLVDELEEDDWLRG